MKLLKTLLLATLISPLPLLEGLGVGSVGLSAQTALYSDAFPLSDVTLLDGPLKHAYEVNAHTLLRYDVDRLLAPFRKEAGLPEIAPLFPNWAGLDGHVGGHYLTAMALYASQGNKECEERMLYMIAELKKCMDAAEKNFPIWGKGYLGGVPQSDKMWTTYKQGDFRTFNSAWVPFYNLHKVEAGLRDCWVYCGNEEAKELFLKTCDWLIEISANVSDEQLEQLLSMEHGGVNEVLADAYQITGDQKYLDAAKRYSHKWLLNPMKEHNGKHLDLIHANTQVPKVVGFARVAELGQDADYLEASRFFWDEVVNRRSLSLGGNSRREHFPSKEACIDWTQDIDGLESCNTNNMLKLTEDLHRMDPDNAAYADFYERATFNHILSTQHPVHGGYVYFTSARPRHYRNYSVPNEAMWCCVGTGMENHGKYTQFIYTKQTQQTHPQPSLKGRGQNEALYVNLYAASTLNWREKGVRLTQETQFPYGETSRITITEGKASFALKLHKPAWCSKFVASVNGDQVVLTSQSDKSEYLTIERKWKKGDVIEIQFPMHASIEHMPNVPQYVALLYGPITLSMRTGTEDLRLLLSDDSRFGQMASGKKLPIDQAPYLIAPNVEDIAKTLEPIPGKPLHFKLNCRMENKIEGELEPFFELHDARYMLYWLALSENGYKEYIDNLAREEAERQALDARTVDKVQPGEQQPESDHFMETDESHKGATNDVPFRDARDGHYFSYLMQTQGQTDLSLRIRYWGQDEWRTCEYDLYVDDQLVQSVNHSKQWRSSQWKYETYPLPASALAGKQQVRIKFVAKPHRQVGELYEVRLLKP